MCSYILIDLMVLYFLLCSNFNKGPVHSNHRNTTGLLKRYLQFKGSPVAMG